MLPRENYCPPAGFAKEPAAERRRWFGRVVLLIFITLVGWLLFYRVLNPQEDDGVPTPVRTCQNGGELQPDGRCVLPGPR